MCNSSYTDMTMQRVNDLWRNHESLTPLEYDLVKFILELEEDFGLDEGSDDNSSTRTELLRELASLTREADEMRGGIEHLGKLIHSQDGHIGELSAELTYYRGKPDGTLR